MTAASLLPKSLPRTRLSETGRAWLLVASLSFLFGCLTAFAQTFLPYSMYSLANSANGWLLVMVPLLWWSRARWKLAAVLGAVSGVLLMIGFAVTLELFVRSYDPWVWTLSAAMAGPFIGLATAWLRENGIRPALGTAALTGVTVGESYYGLTFVHATTSPVYWTLSGLAGFAFLAAMLAFRVRGWIPVTVALIGTVAVAAVFVPVYGTVGSVA